MKNKVDTHSILVEVCHPRDAFERSHVGKATLPADRNLHEVWLDSRQDKAEFIDTFFHEMTHVFLNMFFKGTFSDKKEHRICNLIGYFARSVVMSYVKIRG